MTALMTEPLVTGGNGSDGDDLIHVVCDCFPKNKAGALLALCGTTVDDDPLEGDDTNGLECIVCNMMEDSAGACRYCHT